MSKKVYRLQLKEIYVERKENPCTAGGNLSWYSYHSKQHRKFSKNYRELPYDPANATPGVSKGNKNPNLKMHGPHSQQHHSQ